MPKLNQYQKDFLKTLDSEQLRKKTKKAFKESNNENEVLKSLKILKKFFKNLN
jgi:hypothetical protein